MADNPSAQKPKPGRPGRPSNASRDAAAQKATGSTRKRRPLSVPMRKMELPEIPGFHVHWINDYPGRVEQAQDGGYEFVAREEVRLNERGPTPTDTDLGSRVSMVVGSNGDGTPLRAYAMKIKNEWYEEDQKVLQNRNNQIDESIRRGKQQVEGESAGDARHRYVKTADIQTRSFVGNRR